MTSLGTASPWTTSAKVIQEVFRFFPNIFWQPSLEIDHGLFKTDVSAGSGSMVISGSYPGASSIQLFNFKLGRFATNRPYWVAREQPHLELKTQRWACPACESLPMLPLILLEYTDAWFGNQLFRLAWVENLWVGQKMWTNAESSFARKEVEHCFLFWHTY
jgi:hypothetical protein